MEKRQNDMILVSRARAGEADAIGEIIAGCGGMIKRLAAGYRIPGMETEDFIQEGMLGLLKAVRLYKPEMSSFSTFASICVSSAMATAAREGLSGKHRPLSDYQPLEEIKEPEDQDTDAAPEELVSDKEQAEEWNNKITTLLTSFEQQVLKAYLGGHSYSEIASITFTTTKAVDNALQRVRKKLRSA